MKLTLYLLRPTVRSWAEALDDEVLAEVRANADDGEGAAGIGGWSEVPVTREELQGVLHVLVKRDTSDTPRWAEWFAGAVSFEGQEPRTQNDALLAVLQVGGDEPRFFAITGGHGRAALDFGRVVPGFGRRVVLNATPGDGLLFLKEFGMDQSRRQRSSALARPGEPGSFGLDYLGARVDRAAGRVRPSDGEDANPLNGRVEGGRGLSLDVSGGPEILPELCEFLLDLHARDDYREKFLFADRWVTLDADDAMKAELDEMLVTAVHSGPASGFTLTFPADWEQIVDSRELFLSRSRKATLAAFTEAEVKEALQALRVTPDEIPDVSIRGFDADRKQRYKHSLLEHVWLDATHAGRTYVFADGEWYHVPESFVEDVSRELDGVETYQLTDVAGNPTAFPKYGWVWSPEKRKYERETEGEYDARVARALGLALLDQVFFQDGMGHGRVEPCDLYHPRGHFIHVKRLGSGASTKRGGGDDTKAAGMSHLFTQGATSAQLFADSARFREWLKERVTERGVEWRVPDGVPDKRDHTIVFAIVSSAERRIPEGLPFLIKAAFYQKLMEIRRMDFRVAVAPIVYEDQPAAPPAAAATP